jgi:hypothetical protein
MRLKNKKALMEYDKNLLESWASMEDYGTYMIRNGGLTALQEGFDFLSKEYFSEVKRRIDYCKKLLKDYEDAYLNYVIAKLYDNYDLNESPVYLYEWPVKYYCHRALEFDTDFIPARELLQEVDSWLDFLNGDSGDTMEDSNNDFW